MTKIFQTAWQKNLGRPKYFSTDEIDFSYDKFIARPREIFLNPQTFLNSRSLLSGTRSNGMAIFESAFRKFWSTSGGWPISRKYGNVGNFLFHWGFHFDQTLGTSWH